MPGKPKGRRPNDGQVLKHNDATVCFRAGSDEEELKEQLRELARGLASGLCGLEPFQRETLLGVFVSELFLSVAEQNQHDNRLRKQADGIAAAKAQGVRFGPSRKPLPDNFGECRRKWQSGEMSLREAAEACGMPKSSFYDAALRRE